METPEQRLQRAIMMRFGTDNPVPNGLFHASALASINERSVCRNYRSEPLEEELVNLLCATALSAPSKSDLQQADIIRLRSPEKRAAINALMPNSPWIRSAPEFFVICGDHRRLQQVFELRGGEFPNDHLDAFFNTAVDAGIVLATFVQAVHLSGLGSCPISELRDHAKVVSDLLELPRWVFPVAGLTVGYPLSLEPLSPRLGLESTVFVDRYDSSQTPAGIAEYDRRRIAQRPYARERSPERFGEVSVYGWSEEKFRQYSEIQRADFGAFIRERGFKLE